MYSTFVKSAAIAITLSASFLSSNAVAAPWTFITTGIVQSGSDSQGVFGTANSDLSGLNYSFTTIVDPLAYRYNYGGAGYGYQSHYGDNSGSVTQKITIGNVTKTYTLAGWTYSGQSYMHESPSFDQAYQYNYFRNNDGHYVQAYSSVYSSTNNILNTWNYDQRVAYAPVSSDGGYTYFAMSNGLGSAYFNGGVPTSLSINAGDVPEPAPLALFGLGMVALAFARRKAA